ncbi:hypothetical protein CW751_01665 [Brumimicrobium salinarum]|uniref:histidine kinase n=1 Tax=Brumimicrobium salinarum TaxID=2058658 RepID=A0A2I0R6S1_9FLAO|nr:histidine kinase dimerization/phosphoacceptor domain -containing protein [Brumimicrobium salinarum]PKR82070.1 hypothetical protein CW751_01665 [Brumimicrobium salinarum]
MRFLTIKIVILLCTLCTSYSAVAQNTTSNSNQGLIKAASLASYSQVLKKLHVFDSLANKDSIDYYVEKGNELCQLINTSELKDTTIHELQKAKLGAEIYQFIGKHSLKIKNIPASIINFSHAYELFDLSNMKKAAGKCATEIGWIYFNSGNRVDALKHFHKSVKHAKQVNDSIGLIDAYTNISKVYWEQGDYNRTQKNLSKALSVAKNIQRIDLESKILIAIAGLKKELGDLKSAQSIYEEILSFTKSTNDTLLMSRSLNNLGSIYFEKGNHKVAKSFYDRAYNLLEFSDCSFCIAFVIKNLSQYHYTLNNIDKATELAKQTLLIGNQTENETLIPNALNLLIAIYKEKEQWKVAFKYQKQLLDLNLKSKKENLQQISQHETIRLQLEKDKYLTKKNEIEQGLKKEKEKQREYILYILIGSIVVLLIAALLIFYFRLKSSREKNAYITKQSEERKLLLQEVHHRVKNNFQLVSSMLRLQSYNFDDEVLRINFEEAVNRINAMAIVHDVIYRQEKFSNINGKVYLEKLIKTLQITGNQTVKYEVNSEEIPFKIETLINLGIVINEMITNSNKHAFNQQNQTPCISISLKETKTNTYELIYKDNGSGIKERNFSSGFGMELIETIIDNFDGNVEIIEDVKWNTAIKITFQEN